MKKTHLNNEEGVVLVTTLMMVFVMTLAALSMLELGTNQVMTLEDEAKRIQAQVLAEGHIYYLTAQQQIITNTPNYSDSITLTTEYPTDSESITFDITTQRDSSGNDPGSFGYSPLWETEPLQIDVDF